MDNQVFAQIAVEPEAELTEVGTVHSINFALGADGIVGIKTGSPPTGAVFLFAGQEAVPGAGMVSIFGAVQGLPTLDAALGTARALLHAAPALESDLRSTTIVPNREGQLVRVGN